MGGGAGWGRWGGGGGVKYPFIERNTGSRSLPPALPTHKPQAWDVRVCTSLGCMLPPTGIHVSYLYQHRISFISVYVYVDGHRGHTGVQTLIFSLHRVLHRMATRSLVRGARY